LAAVKLIMQEQLIREFRDTYADQFANRTHRYLGDYGNAVLALLQNSISNSRSTVYLFGNGGSYAICKCLEYALQTYAAARGFSLRTQTGIDVHDVRASANDGSVGVSFVDVLTREAANRNDIVVLISGSGDSDNLCDVALYTTANSIPTLALVGSNRGKLRGFVSPEHCFCVQPDDQQISEDVIQSLAYFIEYAAAERAPDSNVFAATTAEIVKDVVTEIPAPFVATLASRIEDSFCAGKIVWVMGFDLPVLSVCAEHTAHNLYWDSIYQVQNPPERVLQSVPTTCDFTGISNDRRQGLVSTLLGSNSCDKNGVALLYSMNTSNVALRHALSRLKEQNVPAFLLCSEIDMPLDSQANVFQTKTEWPQVHAGIAQVFGHILGRVIRMRLLERERSEPIPNSTTFLADFDLAQRRLLDG
jgi:phosphoheptose isomerase